MTVVLLVIPLILMTALYGSVIKSLRTGIRMDIAAIEVNGKFLKQLAGCDYNSFDGCDYDLFQTEPVT